MSRRGDNIHKRKDGRWEGRYKCGIKEDGSTSYRSVYGKTYSECKSKLEMQKRSEISNNAYNRNHSFSQVLNLWLDSNKVRIKGATKSKYRYMIDSHIIPQLGKHRVSEITTVDINNFLHNKLVAGAKGKKGELSPSYVRTIAIIIESALRFAADEGMCPQRKSSINKPSISKSKITVIPNHLHHQLETILLSDNSAVSLGTLIAFHTGMRIGEICALQWDDIDFNNNLIYVRHTIARIDSNDSSSKTKLVIDTPKTPASNRVIPISSALNTILQKAYTLRCSEFVVSEDKSFVGTRTFDYRYRQLLRRHKIDVVNFHTIRHTFATRCIQSGMDVKTLSEILGHSSVAITLNTYVHSSIETKRNQIEKIYSIA